MYSEFIVKVKNATNNIRKITDDDIVDMELKLNLLIKGIVSTITTHPNIGLGQLNINYEQIKNEYKYTEMIVMRRLNELNSEGKDDYYTDYSNTKEVGLKIEEALDYLLELRLAYFPETVVKYKEDYKRFLPYKFHLVQAMFLASEKEQLPEAEIKHEKILPSGLHPNEVKELKDYVQDPSSIKPKVLPPQKLSIKEIALKLHYEGLKVDRDKCKYLIKQYGYTSGDKLYNEFTYFSSVQNRKGHPGTVKKLDNQIERIQNVIDFLSEDKKPQAFKELETLKSIKNKDL